MAARANNEELKLRAAWLNNVSAGLFVVGFAVLYFSFSQNGVLSRPEWPVVMIQTCLFALSAAAGWKAIQTIRAVTD
jgi:hypothetical protein